MVEVGEQIKYFLSQSIKPWRVDLTCNSQSLGGLDIEPGIFQSDLLSPLLFVLCYIPLTVILHKSEVHINFHVTRRR